MAAVEIDSVVDGEHTPDEDLSLGAIFPVSLLAAAPRSRNPD
jgi:hypothetical protein